MEVVFTKIAWEDYIYWQSTDMRMVKRVNSLLKDILRTPLSGTGKPEPLKFDMASCWSRRINDEHRIVYNIQQDKLVIHQCRYHY
jgi:toxin YoeB